MEIPETRVCRELANTATATTANAPTSFAMASSQSNSRSFDDPSATNLRPRFFQMNVLLRRLGKQAEAAAAYQLAIGTNANARGKEFLASQLQGLDPG